MMNKKEQIKKIIGSHLLNQIEIGQRKLTNGIQMCQINYFPSSANIFIECAGQEKGCHDTISINPKGIYKNEIINSITDNQAGEIFELYGWLIKDYNNDKYTRCPFCKKQI